MHFDKIKKQAWDIVCEGEKANWSKEWQKNKLSWVHQDYDKCDDEKKQELRLLIDLCYLFEDYLFSRIDKEQLKKLGESFKGIYESGAYLRE